MARLDLELKLVVDRKQRSGGAGVGARAVGGVRSSFLSLSRALH